MMRWHSTLCTGWSSLRFLPCSFPRPEKDRTPSLTRWQGLLLMPEFGWKTFRKTWAKVTEAKRAWESVVCACAGGGGGGEEEAP